MQKRQKKQRLTPNPVSNWHQPKEAKVFREDILELKYQLWIARMRFIRGELSDEALREQASKLIAAVEMRQRQCFGSTHRLKLCAAELITEPYALLSAKVTLANPQTS
jgi:hypothetical protein